METTLPVRPITPSLELPTAFTAQPSTPLLPHPADDRGAAAWEHPSVVQTVAIELCRRPIVHPTSAWALHGKGSLPATTSQQPCAVLCTVRRNVPGCRNYKSPCLKRTSIAYSCYGDRARLTTAASRLVPAIENQSLALEGSNYVLQMSP